MRALLDTHILLWWLGDDVALPEAARTVIADPATAVLVSAASVWEIAIKQATGRVQAPDDLLDTLHDNDFATLAITAAHALAAGGLPAHHSDPFDRMLIAQAQAERLTLISVDQRFSPDDVDLLAL